MAVTRSVSKDQYGGEGRGFRNQGVVTGLRCCCWVTLKKRDGPSRVGEIVYGRRTSWCCITGVIIYRILMLGKCGGGGIRHMI